MNHITQFAKIITVCALALVVNVLQAQTCPPDLLVSSLGNQSVLRYDGITGTFINSFVPSVNNGGLMGPEGLAVGPDGHLYVSSFDTDAVNRYDGITGAFINSFVPTGSGGLIRPIGLAFGPDGHLYVASYFTHGVKRYNGTTGAFMNNFVTSQGGGLSGAVGLAFGPDGHLYVSSYNTREVKRYDGVTGVFMNNFVMNASGGLDGPTGLVFGPDGHLYVSSNLTDEVLRYDGIMGAFINSFVPSGSGGLDSPYGLVFGPDGHLYVSSYNTQEVKRYDGTTGAFMNNFVTSQGGGLNPPTFLIFMPLPPQNDDCADATEVFIGSQAFCGTTACATPSTAPGSCGNSANAPDVWFKFKALCKGQVTIDTCGLCSGQSAGFDTVLTVYTGTCGTLSTVACNNDAAAPCSPQSSVTFPGIANQTYYIRVAGKGTASGEFRLNVTAPTGAPGNDDCANANQAPYILSPGSPAACGTTECATPSAGLTPKPCGSSANSPDVWYTFTPPCGGEVTIDTCGACSGLPGTFNTVLSVYQDLGAGCNSLFLVGCNDNASGTGACPPQSRVKFTGNPGVTYYIRVAGHGAAVKGRFRLNIALVVPTTAPCNDLCAPTFTCPGATTIPNGTHPFNTCLATTDLTPSPMCPITKDVWFRYKPACDGDVWVNTCGSTFATVLEIYSRPATTAINCNGWTFETCNVAATAGPCSGSMNSFLTFTAAQSKDYYIRVGGVNGASGAGKLTIQGPFPPVPTCPTVTGNPPLSTRVFRVMGPASGVNWSWSIRMACCVNIEDQNVTGVTHVPSVNNTTDRNALAAAFAASINLACPSGRVLATAPGSLTFPGLIYVTVGSCNNNATPFSFCVGVPFASQQSQCAVANGGNLPTTGLCSFNPEMLELPLSGHDLNNNGVDDALDIMFGTSDDLNLNGIPDEAEDCLSPQLVEEPESLAVLLGTNVTLSVAATGAAPLSYQWHRAGLALTNGGSISGATSNVLSIQPVALADLGEYTVTITNACGTATTFPATLSRDTPTPVIVRVARIGGGFHFAFLGKLNVTYTVEYTGVLPSTSWTVLETVTGYGQELEVVDSAPLSSARFYRIRQISP